MWSFRTTKLPYVAVLRIGILAGSPTSSKSHAWELRKLRIRSNRNEILRSLFLLRITSIQATIQNSRLHQIQARGMILSENQGCRVGFSRSLWAWLGEPFFFCRLRGLGGLGGLRFRLSERAGVKFWSRTFSGG